MRHGAPGRGTTKRREHQVRQSLEVQQAKAQQQELQQKIQIPHTQARPAGNRGAGTISRSGAFMACLPIQWNDGVSLSFQVAGREHSIECTQRRAAVPGQQPADTDADRQEQAGDLEELLERHGCVTSERVRGGVEAVDPVPAR